MRPLHPGSETWAIWNTPAEWSEKRRIGLLICCEPLLRPGASACSIEDRPRIGNRYEDHWSLWSDVKIILKTVPKVFKGSGG